MIALGLLLAAVVAIGLLGPIWRPRCNECSRPADRIIHAGVPMWFCLSQDHRDGMPIGLGWLSLLLGTVLPWDGWLFIAEGPYLIGLWRWWRHHACDHEPVPPAAIRSHIARAEGRKEIADLPLAWTNRDLNGRMHWMTHHAPDVALCGLTVTEEQDEGDAARLHCQGCLLESERLLAQLPSTPRNRDLWAITGEPPPGWR